MRSQHPATIFASLCLCFLLCLVLQPQLLHCATAERGLEAATATSSISRSDRINDGTFHGSQSKREVTFAKSVPSIPATTQIAKANDEQTATTTTTKTTMQTNASLSIAAATALPNHSNINNISNNEARHGQGTSGYTMATSVPVVTAALQANLIMSNRNVEEQEPLEHKNKITQYNALLPANKGNSSTATVEAATAVAATTEESTTTTTTTTRRPTPSTTLKPPPTIDDYQTIISQAGTHAYLPCNVPNQRS